MTEWIQKVLWWRWPLGRTLKDRQSSQVERKRKSFWGKHTKVGGGQIHLDVELWGDGK